MPYRMQGRAGGPDEQPVASEPVSPTLARFVAIVARGRGLFAARVSVCAGRAFMSRLLSEVSGSPMLVGNADGSYQGGVFGVPVFIHGDGDDLSIAPLGGVHRDC